jgi:predicted esterase
MRSCILIGLGLLLACGDGKDASRQSEPVATGDDTAAPEGDTGDELPAVPPLANGLFLLGFNVGPVAGLVVPLQVGIATSIDEAGNRTIDTFILRATDGADLVSDDLAALTDIPVAEDGGFEADMPVFTLPAEFSPTSNPVDIDSIMTGAIVSESFFCGDVTGEIVSFGMDLAGSSFGSVPWEDRILGAPGACEEIVLEDVPRIEDCPELAPGRMMDFVSGGEEREVEIVLPDGHSTGESWPLLLALHGIGSDIDAMVDGSDLREEAQARGLILVAPQAMDRGGTAAWDPVGAPGVNLDVVLVDDLITCVSAQYGVDPERVYITGMSLGGLMTGTLISTRSDVFAAAMPFSGGFMTQPSADTVTIPTLVSWGGEDDTYYGQDFNALAGSMVETLSERGHGVVACNHGTGHALYASYWDWALTFLADHTRSSRALAYDAELPEVFPEFCTLVSVGPEGE